MRYAPGALLAALLFSPAGAAGIPGPDAGLPNEVRETMLDLVIADAVLRAAEFELETCDSAVRLDSRLSGLDPTLRKRLTTRDAWGRPLLYWRCGTDPVLVSLGQDGRLDQEYDFADSISLPATGGGDDIIMRAGEFVKGPLGDRRKQQVSMADLRAIATAVESFAVDNDVYPGPTSGIATVDVVRPQLEPTYIRNLPAVDAWGNPYLFWSDGEHYLIVSRGSDGVEDVAYGASDPPTAGIEAGATRRYESDIVFCDGQFHRWPEGAQPSARGGTSASLTHPTRTAKSPLSGSAGGSFMGVQSRRTKHRPSSDRQAEAEPSGPSAS
jgi:hypothetical protein